MSVMIHLTPAETAVQTSLHERLEPGYLRNGVWSLLVRDPRFADIAHTILEHASAVHPGSEPEIISRYEAFIEGAALVAHSLLSSGDSEITPPIAEKT